MPKNSDSVYKTLGIFYFFYLGTNSLFLTEQCVSYHVVQCVSYHVVVIQLSDPRLA